MRTLLLALTLALTAADKVEVVQEPTSSKSAAVEIHGGAVFLREGEAGAAFATVRLGTGKRTLCYFAALAHDVAKAEKSDFNEEVSTDDKSGSVKQTLSMDGRKVEIVYTVRIDEKANVESLSVNGTAVPLKNGRALLIDLTARPPTWEQRKADLPEEVEASTKKATEDVARRGLAALAKQDKKAKDFIDKAGR